MADITLKDLKLLEQKNLELFRIYQKIGDEINENRKKINEYKTILNHDIDISLIDLVVGEYTTGKYDLSNDDWFARFDVKNRESGTNLPIPSITKEGIAFCYYIDDNNSSKHLERNDKFVDFILQIQNHLFKDKDGCPFFDIATGQDSYYGYSIRLQNSEWELIEKRTSGHSVILKNEDLKNLIKDVVDWNIKAINAEKLDC